jgi:glycosyltransferase involved in cell wall biosynthesis
MTNSPRVSIVMPVYNGEQFIAEAVRSALASTFADIELLVVDDGSTDASVAEATRAAAGDARLRVLSVPHGGVAAARNAALAAARGELIANLDADDVMFPDRVAQQVAFLDTHRGHVAVSVRLLIVDANGRPIRVLGRVFSHDAIDEELLGGNAAAIPNAGAMFRRQAALAIGGYSTHLSTTGEDHDLWLRLAEVGRLANLPDVLMRYRVHGANVSVGSDKFQQRLPITLDTLSRAFARRGITDRMPEKRPPRAAKLFERWTDEALLAHYRGERAGAIGRALVAVALNPFSAAARSALATVLSRRSVSFAPER